MKKIIGLLLSSVFVFTTCISVVGCNKNDEPTVVVYSSDTVLDNSIDIKNNGSLTVENGIKLTVPENKKVTVSSDSKMLNSGAIHVKGTLQVNTQGVTWENILGDLDGSLVLYTGSELYINNELYVGTKYDHNAYISLGNGNWENYLAGNPVMEIVGGETDMVKLNGKVYLNKTVTDSRIWDLGFDSAVVLHADNEIKFRSLSEREYPTASVYTYGGVNRGSGAMMPSKNEHYYPLGKSRQWKTAYSDLINTLPFLSANNMRTQCGPIPFNGDESYKTLNGEDGLISKNLKYTERGGTLNTYDLWLPKSIVDGENKGADIPLMLVVHGGAWTSGTKEDVNIDAARYAKLGYIVANVNPRLAGQSVAEDNGNFFDMMQDMYDCVAKVKAQIETLGYKSTKMAVTGGSAGGHLAMLYAATYGEESPIPVKLCLSTFGPADFMPESWANLRMIWPETKTDLWKYEYEPIESDPYWNEKMENAAAFISYILPLAGGYTEVYTVEQILEGCKDENSEVYQKIKAISPTLLWGKYKIPLVHNHGEMDSTVSVDGTKRQKQIFEEIGGIDSYFIISDLNIHGLIEDHTASIDYYNKATEYLNKYMPIAEE